MVAALVGVALGGLWAGEASANVQPFGNLECAPREGLRVCQSTLATRVKTFDGVPLDVTVTLPAEGDANLPLIVLLHGYGANKEAAETNFEAAALAARRGYAVLAYSARGFGDSCGTPASRAADPGGCARGWIHLADVRYEGHDTQHLAGLLADQGLVDPTRIGVIGVSYGGGQTLMLATLRDRTMLPDGRLVPWVSPGKRLPISLAAAAPIATWSDLATGLLPNGRSLDYVLSGPRDQIAPFGVLKQSFVAGLYALGQSTGYIAPPGADPEADVTAMVSRLEAGEPYDGDPMMESIADQALRYRSAYYLDSSSTPAPVLMANGWTDDLFGVDQAVRYANRVRALHPGTPVSVLAGDFGHPRGPNKKVDIERIRVAIAAWMDHYVKGSAPRPFQGVEALTQTCPSSAPSGGPYRAPSYAELHPGEVRGSFAGSQTVLSSGGDPATARAVDPVNAGANSCVVTTAKDDPGTAVYRLPPAPADGYTLLGAPTVIADMAVSGQSSQVAARLWDVAPSGGQQTLVARGVFRPGAGGPRQVFQLGGNGWRFEPGHVPRLELLGNDAPYLRQSNGAFEVAVANLELRLPVRESASAGGTTGDVQQPAAPVVPQGATPAPAVVKLRLRLAYRRARSRGKRSCARRAVSVRLIGRGIENVRRADFVRGGRRVARDRRAPFRTSVRPARTSARLVVHVRLGDGRRVKLARRLPRC